MNAIHFTAPVIEVAGTAIIHLPEEASMQLPSRGMVVVDAEVNGETFQAPLEPDGKKGHWLRLEGTPLRNTNMGEELNFTVKPTKDIPEPTIPSDVEVALSAEEDVARIWHEITAMSRWDWIRWINGTKNETTRARRIEVMLDKLRSGKRRACCFNRTECTDQSVSKSGVLLEAVD